MARETAEELGLVRQQPGKDTTRFNHSVQGGNSVMLAPAPLIPAPPLMSSAPPYSASASPGITSIPLTVSSSPNRMMSQVSTEVTRSIPGGSPRRNYTSIL